MTIEQALQLLTEATAQLTASRQVHIQILEALRVVRESLQPQSSIEGEPL